LSGRVFVVTGISGTGVGNSLAKYADYARSGSPVAEVIKVEGRIVAARRSKWPDAAFPWAEMSLWTVLQLPRHLQWELWQAAFDYAAQEAQRLAESGRDVFLTFHACWYDIRCREFLSVVDFGRLKALDPVCFITLTDDIYDVGARLSGPNQIFEGRNVDSPFVDRACKLLTILNWRAFEIALTDRLAAACARPHYLFAVKHPISTFAGLLRASAAKVYLSHPITYVRDLWSEGKDPAVKRASELIAEVQHFTEAMRQAFVVFEPTTIDELCFSGKKIGRRWPLSGGVDNLMWVPPPDDRRKEWWELPAIQGTDSEALFEIFVDEIRKQINARDHKLVEQSDRLVVYRPFAGGHYASGVSEEVTYYSDLFLVQMRSTPAHAFHPPKDEEGRVLAYAQEVLRDMSVRQGLSFDDSVWQRFAVPQIAGLLRGNLNSMTEAQIGECLSQSLRSSGIDLYNPRKKRGVFRRDPVVERQEIQAQLGKSLRGLLDSCYLQQAEKIGSLVVHREELDPESCARRFMEC